MHHCLFLLLLAVGVTATASVITTADSKASYCDQYTIPICAHKIPRDVLFLVDASNSMDAETFFDGMLDYTLRLFCALESTLHNQAGMIIFNQDIHVHIPLSPYTRQEWYNQVTTVRETKGTDYPACCSCCTPMAEAFLEATTHFQSRKVNEMSIAFMITDGVPSNNYANAGGNPLWWFNSHTRELNPAKYNTQIVPVAANTLKAAGHRLVVVGVPGKRGNYNDIDTKYFNGEYKNNAKYCIKRDMIEYCSPYVIKDNFPIVSLPVNENSFVTTTWDVVSLVKNTVGALCQLPPTTSPTNMPTASPTISLPTQSPTLQPTLLPTLQPTLPPTSLQPTFQPTSQKPTKSPTKNPTQKPTSQRPTKSPTKLPTQKPTSQKPTVLPTQSPTPLVMEQVDLTFLMDRSNSMNWHSETCQQVIDDIGQHLTTLGNATQTEVTKSMCWELFLRYVLSQADDVAEIMAGETKSRALGWADDFKGEQTFPMKGLRVNVIGFACTNKQRTPKVFSYSDSMMGGPITKRSDLVLLLEELRTTVMPEGGTCPGLAIEYLVKTVEKQPAAKYPLQAAILLTDGVFFDGKAPELATAGLEAYNVLRFAVGIAIANTEHVYGMTAKDIQTQKSQLSKFVGNQASQFKDLGSAGYTALLDISENIAMELKDYYYYNTRSEPLPRYTWCGFRRIGNCESEKWRNQNCQWPKASVSEYGCAPVKANNKRG